LLKTYYALTKPGIIYGNALTAAGGFLLASGLSSHLDYWLLLATLVGISLVIACGCVLNNYIDRDIDKKMARTKKRALANGLIPTRNAMLYASLLGLVGFVILIAYVNLLTVAIGFTGLIFYVIFYGVGKRRSVHGTVIGSVSGAAPIVAGYCAVTGHFDKGALILFLILVCWQMPHFYAIAIYRLKDYKAAGLPVLPVTHGIDATKLQMLVYIAAFALAISLLTIYNYTGYSFLAVMLVLSLAWLTLGLRGCQTTDKAKDVLWARKMFFFSLIVILGLSLMLALGPILP
jgi:protoheme IX farnesyltransferase